MIIFNPAYTEFIKRFCQNPLTQFAIILAPGHWASIIANWVSGLSHEHGGSKHIYNRSHKICTWFYLARADRVRERYSLFYVGNGKRVAYFSKRMTRIRILYCLMKRQPVKTTCKELWKYSQENVVFSYIDAYSSIFVHWHNRIPKCKWWSHWHTAPSQGTPVTSQSNTCTPRSTAM